jgi:hypothetical protein
VHVITRFVGGLFFIKGILGLVTAFGFFDDVYPVSIGANLWDFAMMLLTEIGPTCVFVLVTRRNASKIETRDSETETEMKTYTYDQE